VAFCRIVGAESANQEAPLISLAVLIGAGFAYLQFT
jgi:hypothetical protein